MPYDVKQFNNSSDHCQSQSQPVCFELGPSALSALESKSFEHFCRWEEEVEVFWVLLVVVVVVVDIVVALVVVVASRRRKDSSNAEGPGLARFRFAPIGKTREALVYTAG